MHVTYCCQLKFLRFHLDKITLKSKYSYAHTNSESFQYHWSHPSSRMPEMMQSRFVLFGLPKFKSKCKGAWRFGPIQRVKPNVGAFCLCVYARECTCAHVHAYLCEKRTFQGPGKVVLACSGTHGHLHCLYTLEYTGSWANTLLQKKIIDQ